MMDSRLNRCLEPGLSILVGSADAHGAPSCCRAIALASSDELQTLTAYVPLATSKETIANVASTRRIAIAATHPADHCSTQLKGVTTNVRLPLADESAFVQAELEQFASVLEMLGLPKRILRSVAYWPAFAIEMQVEEIYDQTPGPRAGSRLR